MILDITTWELKFIEIAALIWKKKQKKNTLYVKIRVRENPHLGISYTL